MRKPLAKSTDLLTPSSSLRDLRANVIIKAGPAADGIRRLAETYRMDPASVIRMLAIKALEVEIDKVGGYT